MFGKKIPKTTLTCVAIVAIGLIILYFTGFINKNKLPFEHFKTPELKLSLYPRKDYKVGGDQKKVVLTLSAGKAWGRYNKDVLIEAGIDPTKVRSIEKDDDIVVVLNKSSNNIGTARSIYFSSKKDLGSKWNGKLLSLSIFRKSYFEKYSSDPAVIYTGKEYSGGSEKLWLLPKESSAKFDVDSLDFNGIRKKTISSVLTLGKWKVKGHTTEKNKKGGKGETEYTMEKDYAKMPRANKKIDGSYSLDNKFSSFTVYRTDNNPQA